MHKLMVTPRMLVKQFVFHNQFSGDPPLVGHLCGAGNRRNSYGVGMHQLMVTPRMLVKQFVFHNQFSGDPPPGGSPSFRVTHPRVGHLCGAGN